MDDNQEVQTQSGFSRLCNSIIAAICLSPILVIGSSCVLGWNEKRAVCNARAIAEGKEDVFEVSCTSANEATGELVMFSCDLQQTGLQPLGADPNSDFGGYVTAVTTGLRTTMEMLQCVEHEHRETRKSTSGGGGTETIVTYTYSTEWRSSYISSSNFHKKDSDNFRDNCGGENPTFPSSAPQSGTRYAPEARVGAFTIDGDLVRDIPLTAPVLASSTPPGWTYSGEYYTRRQGMQPNGIGTMRVQFVGNDWSDTMMTVLGENNNGDISGWIASDSWLCSGFGLYSLREGTYTKDKLFENMEAEQEAITYILRFVGFLVIWFALSLCCGPLEVAADCIPCVGPCLGDAIEKIACCIACPPACACALGIIGVVWVAMRPMVGIPLMIIWALVMGGFVAFKLHRQSQKSSAREYGDNGEGQA